MKKAFRNRSRVTAAAAALTVGAIAAGPVVAQAATTPAPPNTTYSTHHAYSYVSAPKLRPPAIHTDATTISKSLSSGDFLIANFKNLTLPSPYTGQSGPLILDSHLQPVWFKPVNGEYTNNLALQTYNGKPALSWWQGNISSQGATLSGEDVVVDQHYRTVATLAGESGWTITQHELKISGHDAWVTAVKIVPQPTGSPVIDSAVQEYDLSKKAGTRLVYTWSALSHIPLSQSKANEPASPVVPWDAYHINSIQLLRGGAKGEFLVSMRNTSAAYLVDIATNNILWTLGGKASTFTFANGASFSWQHDVELHSNNEVSVFDDACCLITGNPKAPFASPDGPSRGLLLSLNMTNHTVSLLHQYVHPNVKGSPIETAFQGNMQVLHNGNVVIGWGSAPFFSEYSSSGRLLFDAGLPSPDVTYRAYLASWTGLPPISQMRQAAKSSHGKTTIYASWDGATRIFTWRVLGGNDAKHLHTVGTGLKRSFETSIRLAKSYKAYKVQALDRRGHVLGTSKAFSVVTKPQISGGY